MFSEISVIKGESQYREYLGEIGSLASLDPDPSSPEGKRLELLTLLVEFYEKDRYRIPLPDPVDAILFRLEQMGLEKKDLAPILGSKSRVSEVLAGKRRLTIPMVRNLSAHLGIPVSALIAESNSEVRQDETSAPIAAVREIVKRGWVHGTRVTQKNASEIAAQLFAKLGVSPTAPSYLRSSLRSAVAGPMDLYAVRLWTARVVLKSREGKRGRPQFVRESFNESALRELARLSWYKDGPALAREHLSKLGIALVFEDHLPGTRLDGAATLDNDGTPIIGMTLRHDRLDNFWFTLLHECAHVILHLHSPGDTFIDDTEKSFDVDEHEIEANRFARDCLIPQEVWRNSDANRLKTPESILELAEALKISPAIVAGRIRKETGNYKLFSSLVGHGRVTVSLGG